MSVRLRRPPSWRVIHFCGWDHTCRSMCTPWYLYLNFLAGRDGYPVRIDLSPPHVRRAQDEFFKRLRRGD